MGSHLKLCWGEFDDKKFKKEACRNLNRLELKQRSDQIKLALENQLPANFSNAAKIILASLHPENDVDLSGT